MESQESPVKSANLKSAELGNKKPSVSLTTQDFTIKYTLGRGAYGDVYLVEKKSDKKLLAMKQIQKRKLEKEGKQYQALIQKEVLSALKHPAITKLLYAFQDKKSLYFILEWCEGGEFLNFIKINIQNLSEQIKRFYVAEIVNILEYLHKNGITHRDIKPQNLMLSSTGHLKIIDFGTAQISKCSLISNGFKQKMQKMKQKAKEQRSVELEEKQQQQQSPLKKQRRSTFVGSCYYLSPQLIQKNHCPPEADLWALGCIIYQLYYLQTPFKDNYQFAVYEKIKKCEVQFPKNKQITESAIDLIKKLLKKDPDQRLGSGKSPQLTYQSLKEHPYFAGLDVDKVFGQQVPQIQQLKQPELVSETKQQLQQKKQKTKTQFSKQMLSKFTSFTKKEPEKKVLIHGLLEKKTFLNYSYYYLIVFDDLSIQRTKSQDAERKKFLKVDLTANKLPATLIDSRMFELNTTQKKYSLKCDGNAEQWVNQINKRFKQLNGNT